MPSASTVAHQKQDRRLSTRRARYEAQRIVWRHTRLKRVAYCGRVLSHNSDGVSVKLTGDAGSLEARAGFSGLQTCGSTWSCPVCSEKIQAVRQSEVHTAITTAQAAGWQVIFGTLTLRHHVGDRLAQLWDAISPAWNRATSGAGVAWHGSKKDSGEMGDKARFGIQGMIRVIETKYGANGWHPHIHFLMFVNKPLSTNQISDLQGRLFARWESALANKGISVLAGPGIDLRPVHNGDQLADYFAKMTYRPTTPAAAAYEVTGSVTKQAGARGSRTPFDILRDLVTAEQTHELDKETGLLFDRSTGEVSRDLWLWHEWEAASKGRRQLTWSHGLRNKLDDLARRLWLVELGQEKTDEQIIEDEKLAGSAVWTFTPDEWKDGRWSHRRVEILEAAEAGRLAQLLAGAPPD